MRIVGGEFRGRTLAAPKSNDIRPTIDRTRESLFNILAHAHPGVLDGTRILDLFAGTGAVGIEALSRGCKSALFVENSVEGRSLLWENIDALGLHGRARILRRDATNLGPANNIEPFELLFADPPYGKGLGEKALLAAHRRAEKAGLMDFSDDAALAEWAGMTVTVFEGESTNMKLTTPDDFVRAQALANQTEVRTAMGFDVHAFGSGDHIMLGGVRIPFDRGLSGHSDADVGLHALVDALLGTLADGDIGTHFPPSDPKWKGASSDLFLEFAVERVRARGGTIAHLDLTIVCEAPKIGPHRDAIRARVAGIAAIDVPRVAVKATTSERLGFTGREEGIAAMATATIRLPWDDATALAGERSK